MKYHQSFLSGCIAAVCLLSSGAASAETTFCTAITSLPYVISAPGSYCLKQKFAVNMSSGAAITINANNVVLDLNANAIGNLAAPAATTQAIGIYADSRQNVTVQNGIVRGFFAGVGLVDLAAPGTASGNVVSGITADQSRQVGIIMQGAGAVVRNSRVVGTNGSSMPISYTGNVPNDAEGIHVGGVGAQVIGNEVINTDCTNGCLSGSFAAGIYVDGSTGAVVWQNRVINGTMATAATSTAINVDALSLNTFIDQNYLSGYSNGIVFSPGSTGKYRDTLTTNVTTPYTGGTAVGATNN